MLSVILVDDEASTLDGLSHILSRYPDEFYVASAATSAIQLLGILEKEPHLADVVVTDIRMPVMDGVELVKILTAQYPHIKVVVLSGYSDFEYVRTCLKHGAADYLLKPCRYRAFLALLRQIAAEKASGEWNRRKKTAINSLRDAILSGGEYKGDQPFHVRRLFCFRPVPGEKGLAALVGDCVRDILGGSEYDVIEADRDVLLFVGADWEDTDAKKHWDGVYRRLSAEKRLAALACAKVEEHGATAETARLCRDLAAFAEFNGIARPVLLEEKAELAGETEDAAVLEYLNKDRFARLLFLGNRQSPDKVIQRYILEFPKRERYWNPVRMKKATARLIFGVERPVPNGRDGEISPDDTSRYMERIKDARKPEDLVEIIRDFFCANSLAGEYNRQPRYITEAVSYINAHYMQNLLLSDLARKVFLNEWYFSSQFKKHMGVSFKEYLNQVRIEAAKRLLPDKELKVSQVAEIVGFGDATYFATCFKNCTGATPMEYRKQTPAAP